MRSGRAGLRGASDAEEQGLCVECGKAIEFGSGRFNVGSRSYHVKCYDAVRHLGLPENACVVWAQKESARPGAPMRNTVLVVDDLPDARYSMGRPLAAAGFDVRETATGRDALRLARLQVDAIVLDLALPDMNGYDVLRKLKNDPATRNISVIMKTGVYLDEGHRQVALDAGAAEYFAEPFDTQALVTTVRRVLDSRWKP